MLLSLVKLAIACYFYHLNTVVWSFKNIRMLLTTDLNSSAVVWPEAEAVVRDLKHKQAVWPGCSLTLQHPGWHMWVWLEAPCGSLACAHRQGIVTNGSTSENTQTRWMRPTHLGHFTTLVVSYHWFPLQLVKHPLLWPAGWPLVAFKEEGWLSNET